MTKNRAQPTRYRPGKAEEEDAESEEESSEEEDNDEVGAAAPAKAPAPKATSFPSQQKKLAVDLSRAGHQTSIAPQPPSKKPDEDLEGFVTASESSSGGGEENGSSDEEAESSSSEEEESSSDDEPKKPMLAPKFISKAQRQQPTTTTNGEPTAEAKAAENETHRQQKTDALLQAHLERDAAARAAGKKYWDEEDVAPEDAVDDTDDVAPEAEHAAWKLRELKRVRRERVAIEEKEKEREEVERRRNLSAEEREEEDRAFVEAQKEEREGRGKVGYMQKYFHKGAFFGEDGQEQDAEVQEALHRDFAGRRVEDEASDKSVLPEYMRVRDMTRLGKKGRTKYKDLKDEDTGRWGVEVGRKRRELEFGGVDERFRPDGEGGGRREGTGANTAPVGERRRREDDGGRGREGKRARYD